jgi:hypothetical protein
MMNVRHWGRSKQSRSTTDSWETAFGIRVYASPVGPWEDRSGILGPTAQRCRVPTRHVWGQGKAVGVQRAGGFAEGRGISV